MLGMSRYKTPLQLYMEKRGEADPVEETFAMRFGSAAEAFILSEFERNHGCTLIRAPDTMRRGPMLTHLDGWIPGEFNVQAKTSRSKHDFGEPGTDAIPMEYALQVQAEMFIAQVDFSYVPVLFSGSEYAEYEVEADAELQGMIEAEAKEFWQRVKDGNPPDPVSFADAQARFGRSSREAAVEATAEVMAAVKRLRAVKDEITRLEAMEAEQKGIIMIAMGESATLVSGGNTLATWRAAKAAQRFDAKAFQVAEPALYAKFLKTSEVSRRFLLKEAS
jgi:predicted phage-related endonuclease